MNIFNRISLPEFFVLSTVTHDGEDDLLHNYQHVLLQNLPCEGVFNPDNIQSFYKYLKQFPNFLRLFYVFKCLTQHFRRDKHLLPPFVQHFQEGVQNGSREGFQVPLGKVLVLLANKAWTSISV